MIITIDGFASTGKTTLGNKLAKKLNYTFIDSGLFYRYFAYKFATNEEEILIYIKSLNENFFKELNNEVVQYELQKLEVGKYAGIISKNDFIRKAINNFIRNFCKNKNYIIAGRDVALNIFPKADLKILLLADLETRIKRRLKDKNYLSYNEISDDLIKRDSQIYKYILAITKIAILVDNTNMSFDETFNYLYKLVKDKKKHNFILFYKLFISIFIIFLLYYNLVITNLLIF